MSIRRTVSQNIVSLAVMVAFAPGGWGMAAAQATHLAANVPNSGLLDRRARLHVDRSPLLEALQQLERQSGVALAYSPSLLPSVEVSCACASSTIREALDALLAGTMFEFSEMEGQIMLFPAPLPVPRSRRASTPMPEVRSGIPATALVPTMADLPFGRIQPATIAGTVTREGGLPVGSAAVTLRSLQLSTTTDEAGGYQLVVPAERVTTRPDTLDVRRLGFRPAAVAFSLAPGAIRVDVVLATQAVALQEIVVTGTAGNQMRVAQSAVVSSIDASDVMAKAPVLDVNELLYARAPGVSMTTASGTSGANTRIDIRGQASVSLSNYPLVFIDGVRVTAGPRTVIAAPGGTTAGAGGQQFSALNDLNPDDIESIEIVKGPAAATLYGADASTGVIQILTKRGRTGTRPLSHRLTFEYDNIDPAFTPYDNYGTCTAALVAPTSTNPLCRGQAVGTIVSDNVLRRNGAFSDGWSGSLLYSGQGGGENHGYYVSFSGRNEQGTTPSSYLKHRTGRVNLNWVASPRMQFDVSVGMIRADDRLPQGDQASNGFLLMGLFGSPLSVTTAPGGSLTGGAFNNNLTVEAISAIHTGDETMRMTPSVTARYNPLSWFTNRLTLGGDLTRTTFRQMYPKNSRGWYGGIANTGSIAVLEGNTTVYTVDYLGNINARFGTDGWISSDLSFGTQFINTVNATIGGTGQELLTNSFNLISGAVTRTGAQGWEQSKSWGFLMQEQVGFRDRLFVQIGARLDQHSSFPSSVGSFFLPKAGISYVVSEEPFWRERLGSVISTLRLRTAYGTTGRSPSGVDALETYVSTPYLPDAGPLRGGVSPGSPGNPDIKPERGTEFEAGFDAGFFNDRAGLELTYFAKTSKDVLFRLPLPPSSGFSSNPLVNIGEVTNKGLEISLRATPIARDNVTWDAGLNLNTLSNKLVSMGSITPFVSANNQCFKPGVEIAAWCVPRVLRVDTVAGRAIVSDTAQLAGGQLPKYTGSVHTTVTLFKNVRLYGQADGKFGHRIYNLTRDFRDRALLNSADVVLPAGQGGYSTFERIRRLGPFFAEQSGAQVGRALVRDPYIVDGDFVRFRELSVSWSLPVSIVSRLPGATAVSIAVGGRNLGLWTRYDGWDPEVIGVVDPATPFLADVFTTPQSRRLFTRLNVQF
jgi:TonB-linked SusC/RagA family outer membrane protein